jgi:hypothetical protein
MGYDDEGLAILCEVEPTWLMHLPSLQSSKL